MLAIPRVMVGEIDTSVICLFFEFDHNKSLPTLLPIASIDFRLDLETLDSGRLIQYTNKAF